MSGSRMGKQCCRQWLSEAIRKFYLPHKRGLQSCPHCCSMKPPDSWLSHSSWSQPVMTVSSVIGFLHNVLFCVSLHKLNGHYTGKRLIVLCRSTGSYWGSFPGKGPLMHLCILILLQRTLLKHVMATCHSHTFLTRMAYWLYCFEKQLDGDWRGKEVNKTNGSTIL